MDDDLACELQALQGILSDPSAEPIKLSYGLLKHITDDFSNKIGHGGFGDVYLGDLGNGLVAVKRSTALITDKQFMDEIKCLKGANHKNVVRFLGYCANTEEEVQPLDGTFVMAGKRNRLFCFQYVSNGNIRQYLQQENPHGDDWSERYQMIRGICHGLRYLHDNKINHLDLKPENVMLDAQMEPIIADFGLSRLLDKGQSTLVTKHIVGTLRYIAPEIIDKGELSFKADVYALGVIIIELLTGISLTSLQNWDESVDMDCPGMGKCTEIAHKCTQHDKRNRPIIHEVIRDLDELESIIPRSAINKALRATMFNNHNHQLSLRTSKYTFICDACNMFGKESEQLYGCEPCNFTVHIQCATAPAVLKHPLFVLIENQTNQKSFMTCQACGQDTVGLSYFNEEHNLYLHPCCAVLPRFVIQDGHAFQLVKDASVMCGICHDKSQALSYRTSYNGEHVCLHVPCIVLRVGRRDWQASAPIMQNVMVHFKNKNTMVLARSLSSRGYSSGREMTKGEILELKSLKVLHIGLRVLTFGWLGE